MPPEPDPLTLAHHVAQATRGRAPTHARRLHSICNDVFRLTFDHGPDAVLKLYTRPHGADRARRGDRAAVELHALQLVASRGLPTPPIEAAEPHADTPWLLMTSVGDSPAGQPDGLTPDASRAAFRRCGELFARVHAIRLPPAEPRPDAPPDDRPPPLVPTRQPAHHPADPVLRWCLGRAAAHAPPPLLDRLRAAALRPAPDPALCHGDFHPDQCVRDGPTVTAIVDWESATAGDPAADHAKFANYLRVYFPPDAADEALAGYAAVRPPPDPGDPHYLALRLLQALALQPHGQANPAGASDRFALAWTRLATDLSHELARA